MNPNASWHSDDNDYTSSIAWGDVDGDGDLDLAVGNSDDFEGAANKLYLNEGGTLQTEAVWVSNDSDFTSSIAWGDVDGDDDLDLAAGGSTTKVYLNEGGILQTEAAWVSNDATSSIAWGDVDGDGDLDLAVGNFDGPNKVYLNEGSILQTTAGWVSDESQDTVSIAWGDVDGDGDLDLAMGNIVQPNQIYLNDGNGLQTTAAWTSNDTDYTQSVAWGDVDGDGDLDLAAGNHHDLNKVYLNEGGTLQVDAAWTFGDENDGTSQVVWGDVDGDGDLDLAAAIGESKPNKVYLNENGVLQSTAAWISNDMDFAESVAWGDVDGDGDLDLAVGTRYGPNKIYLNEGMTLERNAVWASDNRDTIGSVAWGDVDGDGDLDLAAGGLDPTLYLNEAGMLQTTPLWTASDGHATVVAWGDMDGDGDLDLAAGGDGTGVYLNEGGTLQTVAGWTSSDADDNRSIAWGDMDGDGDLDLAVGNWNGPNKVYLNEGGTLQTAAGWVSSESEDNNTNSIAWGDVDGDGDLDLAAGNTFNESNRVYLNDGGILETAAEVSWSFGYSENTSSLAWGDMDGDGDLDLAVGNFGPNKVYLNAGGVLQAPAAWSSTEGDATTSVAWGDVDGDGDLDLVAGNFRLTPNGIYLNEGGMLQTTATWTFSDDDNSTISVAWGDVDGDGDLDLAVGDSHLFGAPNMLYLNQRPAFPFHAGQTASVALLLESEPVPTFNGGTATALAPANFYATSWVRENNILPIRYTLFHPASEPVRLVRAFYSLAGSGHWLPAVATSDTVTTDLATDPYPIATAINTHVFNWDIFASEFFGQSDNVVFRIEALPDFSPIPNGVPGPFQRPFVSAQTFPFRVRGTQVRVYDETATAGNEASGALVYRLPAGQSIGAEPIANSNGQPFRSDANGYLQGHGRIGIGDQLVAIVPVSTTEKYTLYHTSAAPTTSGLAAHTVVQPGVQELVLSAENRLILFDLDVSLEWDARNDRTFLTQLEHDIQRASQILFDLTNGQAALGQVHVYHNRENWRTADIVIQASNSQRPSAVLGGVVITPTHDFDRNGSEINNAFIPGQVRMGPTWNRFGEPSGTVGEDWPRALAHELGHFLLFMADNYLGLNEEGALTLVDCQGSAMTDPYAYSEFLTRDEWNGQCLNTLAEIYLGRADWETITRRYPIDGSGGNSGPNNLPLAVTQVTFVEPPTPPNTLATPFFKLTDAEGSPLPLPSGRADGYLLKTQNSDDPTDDYMIALGSPVGDIMQARGAAPGDRLCVFDYSHDPLRLGCLDPVNSAATSVRLYEVPDWDPQIQVSRVNTRTFAITVTNVSESALNVQLLPALGTASEEVVMIAVGDDFTQTIVLDDRAYFGFVRVWVPDSNPYKELIVAFSISEEWNAQAYAWGAQAYAWGAQAYAWGAPILSSDGQVSIFAVKDPFGDNANYTLQVLPSPPSLPSWLTPVGRAYRVSANEPLTDRAILFRYLGRDVPAGQESGLRIYYSPDEGQTWQRLEETVLDRVRNYASVSMPAEGIYVLIATVELPMLTPGWNTFAYPVPTEQPMPEALASIDGLYTSVYHCDQALAESWRLYDATVLPAYSDLVNTLARLEFGHVYHIYATDFVTPYLSVRNDSATALALNLANNCQVPPATFYGPVMESSQFTPTAGMPVTAEINGVVCGEATVVSYSGQLAYTLQVRADNISGQPDGCGAVGRNIVFKVDGQVMNTRPWDNTEAWFHPLPNSGTGLPIEIYLPVVMNSVARDGTP